MTDESGDLAAGHRMRWLWPVLKLAAAIMLLAVLPTWIVLKVRSGDLVRVVPKALGVGHAFESDSLVSRQEVEPVLAAASDRIGLDTEEGNRWRLLGSIATWVSFALSSLITLLAGWHGALTETDQSSARAAAAIQKRNRKLARGVGLLAAAVSVLTATGSRMEATAERHDAHADKLLNKAHAARRAVIDARTPQAAASARETLDEVKQLTRR